MTNEQIAEILYELADFYAMKKIQWKPRAYEKAAEAVAGLDRPVSDIYEQQGMKGLLNISGVGRGIAEHIQELLKTKKLKLYEQMRKRTPVKLSELRNIPGLGPRTVATLYQKLGIRSLKDLQQAIKLHKISELPGFGEKSEEQIAAALKFHTENEVRYLLGYVEPIVEQLKSKLEQSGHFKKIMIGGSYRRRQETVGDIDILATSDSPQKAMDFFVKLPGAAKLEKGMTKSVIRLSNKMQVDLRIVGPASWGAAAVYFTGDKAHNIHLRKIAIAKRLKLSEYGLGKKSIAVDTEEKVYKALGMDFIPPEIRIDSGEIELARKRKLPKLLTYGSVRGDLQVQTKATDGSKSIEEMAKAAMDAGLEYIAITDHTKTLYMTGGLDEKRLEKQGKEIDKLNKRFKNEDLRFKILKGAEVNILKDGSLDIADETLAKLDVVGISIHSHFKMPAQEMTKRILRALSNPNVDIFFHPTTRLINRRPPVEFDFDAVLKACKKYRVALEIDAYPDRLDIKDTLIRKAVVAGVKLVIDSDAHHPLHFGFLKYGEAQARRGWATKGDVLNAKPLKELLTYFSK